MCRRRVPVAAAAQRRRPCAGDLVSGGRAPLAAVAPTAAAAGVGRAAAQRRAAAAGRPAPTCAQRVVYTDKTSLMATGSCIARAYDASAPSPPPLPDGGEGRRAWRRAGAHARAMQKPVA